MTNVNTGLTDEEVIISKEKYGTNKLIIGKTTTFFSKIIESMADPIIRILLIALGIKVVFSLQSFDWYETVGIVISILVASLISSISEYGSEKSFKKLQDEASKIKCRLKRNGQITEKNIDDVVVGDLVILETGDYIPADGVIVSGNISVDESSLTGETKEVIKDPYTKRNVYKGTTVYSNKAIMQVGKVGLDTMYGKISLELTSKQVDSPLKIRLSQLAKFISKIGYIGAFLVSFSYLFSVIVIENNFNVYQIMEMIKNTPLLIGHILYALTLCVTIIIVAVPEGLPVMITLVLSSNMKRMIKNNVLVRKMVGIETAGNLNILFTDKTGTLTNGKLEAIAVVSGSLKEYSDEYELSKDKKYYEVIKTSIIYNTSSVYENGKVIGGNITDRAILEFIKSPLKKDLKIIESIPFDSKNKYSTTTIKKDKNIKFIKGAPEKIFLNCKYYLNSFGEKKELIDKKRIENKINEYTKRGIRVIALALNDNYDLSNTFYNLTFLGLILIKDEIRKEAIKGVKLVKDANIDVVMITGDNKNTASSIAKEVGILNSEYDVILTSEEFNKMSDLDVKRILPNLKILSRAMPQDKSRLVRISQELNLVVGMTGDGVNDAVALKKADVGFAMGSGTEVAKEASDIIILDDNFMSISKAVLFGRTIFKSIRKFIILQLTINLCAMMLSLIGPFIGINTPVTVIQMLWINMVMDTLAGLAFAFEPPLLEYMKEKPKKKNEPIINKYMLNEILFTGIYSSILCFLFLKLPLISKVFRTKLGNEELMTAFFGLFIFIDIFNSLNARTHRINVLSNIYKNKVFLVVITFIIIVQLLLIYFGGQLFRTSGLSFRELQITILLAFTVIPIDWVRKCILKKKGILTGV